MCEKEGEKICLGILGADDGGVGYIYFEVEIDVVDDFDGLGYGEGVTSPFEFICIVLGQDVSGQIEEVVVLFVFELS